jgi:ABC-2 type transport system permease protein
MKAWEITKKDLRILVRDARALFVLLVLPLVFITIIGLTMGKVMGWSNSNQILRLAVLDSIAYDKIGGPGWDAEDTPPDKNADPKQNDQTSPDKGTGDKTAGDKASSEKASSDQASPGKTAASEKNAKPATAQDTAEPPMDAEEKIRQNRIARNIVVKVINQLQEQGGFEITEVFSNDWAQKGVDYKAIQAAVIFGPDFYRRVAHLAPADVFDNAQLKQGLESLDVSLVAKDPNASTQSLIQQLVYSEIYKAVVPTVLTRYPLYRRLVPNLVAQFDAETDGPALKIVHAKPRPIARESEIFRIVVPSYTVFFVFFIVTFMARSVLHERELGTLRRLRIAPLKPLSLLAGKTIPYLLISLTQTAILFICGRLIFDFQWGAEPWLLVPVIFATSLAATSLGLLVATLVRSESQVSAYATILVITMGGISGCFTPRFWLPDAMRELSLTTPHAWSLIAYEEILTKATPNLPLVFECCTMLVAFAVVFFVGGSLRFRSVE